MEHKIKIKKEDAKGCMNDLEIKYNIKSEYNEEKHCFFFCLNGCVEASEIINYLSVNNIKYTIL